MLRYLVWAAACVMLWTLPAAAEKKVALVLGNSEYQHATPLPNPKRDAAAMATMLEGIGFEVIHGTNLTRQAMADKIREFATRADGAQTVLYFYAGHGIQLGGQNYLIPVDANLNTEMDVKFNTLDIDLMLQQTPVTAQVKLVLLDACRNNPFKEQIARSMGKTRSAALGQGLAEMKPTFGTLIAYATGPGEVALDGNGANSPFTSALIKYLPEPGLEIGQAMTRVRAAVYADTGNQQLPWENKNLTSDYFLTPAPDKAPEQKVASLDPVQPVAPAEPEKSSWTEDNGELVLWQAVKESTDPTEVQAYLDKYGEGGTFALSAKKRIAALEAKAALEEKAAAEPQQTAATEPEAQPEPEGFTPDAAIATAEASPATEATLSLGKTDKKILHIKLSALGYGSRSLGAEFDEQSRMAIARWQSARGYPVTGYLNRFMYDALLNDDAEVEAALPEAAEPEDAAPAGEKKAQPKFYPKAEKKAAPKLFYPKAEKKAAKKAQPKFYPKPEPKIVTRKPAIKRKPAPAVVDKPPPKKVKKLAVARPIVVVKKRRPAPAGKRPSININIGTGGGLGIGFGF